MGKGKDSNHSQIRSSVLAHPMIAVCSNGKTDKKLNQMGKMIILSSTAMILVCNFHSQWWGSSIQVLHSLDPLLEPINLSRKKTSTIPEQGLRSPMHTFALSLCTFIPLKSKIIAPTFLTFLDLSKTDQIDPGWCGWVDVIDGKSCDRVSMDRRWSL